MSNKEERFNPSAVQDAISGSCKTVLVKSIINALKKQYGSAAIGIASEALEHGYTIMTANGRDVIFCMEKGTHVGIHEALVDRVITLERPIVSTPKGWMLETEADEMYVNARENYLDWVDVDLEIRRQVYARSITPMPASEKPKDEKPKEEAPKEEKTEPPTSTPYGCTGCCGSDVK